jgi:hypothetical protein
MYENQVSVAPEDAGFVDDYSLVVREAARLNVTLSNEFNSMVFGFIPNQSIVPLDPTLIDNTNQFLAMNKNNIAVGNAGQYVIYAPPGWAGNQAINLDDTKVWTAINDSNIAVSNDGYWTQYDPFTEWSVPALTTDDLNTNWYAINNNNIVVGQAGAWSIYDKVTHRWSATDYISDSSSIIQINDNNIAIESGTDDVLRYVIYNKTTGWSVPLPINSLSSSWKYLNNNNLLISADGFAVRWNGTAWVDVAALPAIYNQWIALNDNNIALSNSGDLAKYDHRTNTWTKIPFDGETEASILNNNNIILSFLQHKDYFTVAEQYVEQPPYPTEEYVIQQNIVAAKRQLVTAYAAKYGAAVPYD